MQKPDLRRDIGVRHGLALVTHQRREVEVVVGLGGEGAQHRGPPATVVGLVDVRVLQAHALGVAVVRVRRRPERVEIAVEEARSIVISSEDYYTGKLGRMAGTRDCYYTWDINDSSS